MTLTINDDIEQGSEAWLDLRRGIVTASVIGRLVTPSTLKTANNDDSRALTAQLVAERITGWVDSTWVSYDMMRGSEDEPRARSVYAKHFAPVREVGFIVREEPTWKLGFSPDGLVGDEGLLEIKSRRPKKQLQTVLADAVPTENVAQIQAGLLVSGRKWCDYVSFAGGMHLYVTRVYPDAKWHAAIIAAVEQFESDAAEMEATYRERVTGLPLTERVIEMDMVI